MKKFFIKEEARIPFTKDGYAKILVEKEKLLAERPDAVENFRKAREMGDLSENGYYKASRQRLSFIDGRLRRIQRLVKLGVIVSSSGSGRVEIGSVVQLSDGTKEYTFTIVGGYESDPSHNTISHISPLGRVLIGKEKGMTVSVHAPVGIKSYTILDVQ